jgi:hypothetical protein
MPTQLIAGHARESLTAHVGAKGAEIFAKYGPQIGWTELQAVLNDRSVVRYPCTVEFNACPLQPGEFAYPLPKGARPEDGFTLCVHPRFQSQPAMVSHLVLYQLVAVNYGEFASPEDAEVFGSAALGIDRDLYYQVLCQLADLLGSPVDPDPDHGGCGHGCNRGPVPGPQNADRPPQPDPSCCRIPYE